MANRPTGPAPHTATTSPDLMSHMSAPMYPVGRMSDRNRTWSSLRSLSIFNGPMSANGTRAYSAWPPAYPPVRCEYPKIPAVGNPNIFSANAALGLVFSHKENWPRSHARHAPHAIGNGTTTRSPTVNLEDAPD